jgi:hypothetical protein
VKDQFITKTFAIEIAIAIFFCIVIYWVVRHYNKGTSKVKLDYFRVPTNNVLVILGLLAPIMIGLASYLYVNNPKGHYSSLLATITVMFLVLIVTLWETFALPKKADATDDTITLTFPGDLKYIVGLGWMYALLLLALGLFAWFFLFELPSATVVSSPQAPAHSSYALLKPAVSIGQSRQEVLSIWGASTSEDSVNRVLIYESTQSVIRLTFDQNQVLVEVNEKRK